MVCASVVQTQDSPRKHQLRQNEIAGVVATPAGLLLYYEKNIHNEKAGACEPKSLIWRQAGKHCNKTIKNQLRFYSSFLFWSNNESTDEFYLESIYLNPLLQINEHRIYLLVIIVVVVIFLLLIDFIKFAPVNCIERFAIVVHSPEGIRNFSSGKFSNYNKRHQPWRVHGGGFTKATSRAWKINGREVLVKYGSIAKFRTITKIQKKIFSEKKFYLSHWNNNEKPQAHSRVVPLVEKAGREKGSTRRKRLCWSHSGLKDALCHPSVGNPGSHNGCSEDHDDQ